MSYFVYFSNFLLVEIQALHMSVSMFKNLSDACTVQLTFDGLSWFKVCTALDHGFESIFGRSMFICVFVLLYRIL